MPSRATRWKVRSTGGGQGRQHAAGRPRLARAASSSTGNGSPPLAAQICSAASGVESREPVGEQPRWRPASAGAARAGARPRAPPGCRRPRAWPVVGAGRCASSEQHPLGHRAARQVVQQPQRRLVGLVDVVDDEQQPVPAAASRTSSAAATNSRWWPASPLQVDVRARTARARSRAGRCRRGRRAARGAAGTGRRAPRAPARTATGPRPPTRCRARPASRAARARAAARSSTADLPDARRPGDEQRAARGRASAWSRRSRSWSPTSRRPTSRGARRGVVGRLRSTGCAQPRAQLARASGLGVVPSSRRRAWSSRSNWRSAARMSPRSALARGQGEVRLLVGGLLREHLLPPPGQAQQVAGAAAGRRRAAPRSTARRGRRAAAGRRTASSASAAALRRTRGRARLGRRLRNSLDVDAHLARRGAARPRRCAAPRRVASPPSARRA